MNIMDFELQRERRTELLREAAGQHPARGSGRRNRRKEARGFRKLAGLWVVGR